MASTASHVTQPVDTTAALNLLETMLADAPLPVGVRLWDGRLAAPRGDPVLTITIRQPEALRRLLSGGSEAELADLHLSGDIDLDGDPFSIVPVARALLDHHPPGGLAGRARLAIEAVRVRRALPAPATGSTGLRRWASLHGIPHSQERDRAAIQHHYDLSNRFFQLFLDPAMVYSCAVFARADEDLAVAQVRKLELVCRKLRLQPGERLLDIGCGWGALLLHAARQHGVTAVGITLAERQAELARERILAAGLQDQCRVEVADYRVLPGDGAFDKIASIGMFEHVGRERAPEYFRHVYRLLRPGGAYLHHAIATDPQRPQGLAPTLTSAYVFPDGEPLPIGDTIEVAELAGFEVRDVESLREHYALTLRHWVASLEARHAEAAAEVGEATWRAWRLLFAGAAYNFEHGQNRVAQSLFVKPHTDGSARLPLERRDWYREA